MQQIVPLNLGIQHGTKASAHRSYTKVYHALSIASFLLYWRLIATNITANTPPVHSHIWDVFTNTIRKHDVSKTNRILAGLSVTGQKLKLISAHPAVSVTSFDVLFTSISLLAWTFLRNLDVDDVLESSVLSFLAPKHEKHVSFASDAPIETTSNKGKRSKKSSVTEPSSPPEASTSRIRRSMRGKGRSTDGDSNAESTYEPVTTKGKAREVDYESDADSSYQPSATTKRDVAETETDGATIAGEIGHAGESTALALFLVFVGGLGQLAAGALGAEVAGPKE